MHLKHLYVLILQHGFVPNSFGCGVSVLLVKDKMGNLNDVDNYRGITLSPIISNLFEMSVLEICNDIFSTDSLQFGFKTGTSCADAIFTLKTTDQYFTDEGSSVSIASLGISKAFDRVHHFKLYNSLLSAGITIVIVDVLFNWYSKLSFGSRPSDHYFHSVCLSVCLFVCAEFFSAVFDPISIKLGHMLYVWV